MSKYIPKTPFLGADAIILNKRKQVLLAKRAITPYKGYWVLPGGHVDIGETVEQAMKREAFEETGLKPEKFKLLGVYSDPKRDPRYHIVTITYIVKQYAGRLTNSFESSRLEFFSLNKLPKKLGFDHQKMINDYKKSR